MNKEILTFDHAKSLLPEKCTLAYLEYKDELDEKTLASILESEFSALDDEWAQERIYEGAMEELKSLRSDLYDELGIDDCNDDERDELTEKLDAFMEENNDELRYTLEERDDSNLIGRLLEKSTLNVRVSMFSNFDCINSHWLESQGGYSYQDSYFGDMVDVLNLNPQKMKRAMVEYGINVVGKWPNLKKREGMEFVDYGKLCTELENNGCPSNLVLLAQYPCEHLGRKSETLTIPKGNKCGLFSHWQGGGSLLECELLRPMTFAPSENYPYLRVDADCSLGYSVKEVFGCDNSIFDGELSLTFEPTEK